MLRDIQQGLCVWQYEEGHGTRQCVLAGLNWHLRATPGPRETSVRQALSLLPGEAINELYSCASSYYGCHCLGAGESPQADVKVRGTILP